MVKLKKSQVTSLLDKLQEKVKQSQSLKAVMLDLWTLIIKDIGMEGI